MILFVFGYMLDSGDTVMRILTQADFACTNQAKPAISDMILKE